MTDLINLTPHAIAVYPSTTPDQISGMDYAPIATIPASGALARLAEHHLDGGEHVAYETYADGAARIPLATVQYSAVEGLPPERDGVLLIVPLVTALPAPWSAAGHWPGW